MGVRIPAAGREYLTWDLTGLPAGVTSGLDVTFDDGATWHPAEIVDGDARLLVAGPDATGNPPGTVALTTTGRLRPQMRLVDNPEIVIRGAGIVDVY